MIFDPSPYIAGHRAANAAELAAIKKRAARAAQEARLLAERILAHDPAVEAVILFGSLAEGEPSHLDFDIDLALVGGDTYRAMEVTEESDFRVDVVSFALLPEHVRMRVKEKGMHLVQRKGGHGQSR